MAILKFKDLKGMSEKEREEKKKELEMELIKGSVQANKATAKTKELKRALSRLYTYGAASNKALNKSDKGELKGK
tara:strand:+ start:348 stop:572 length:225 start_codon:yes stop_codon:yes gene_type:complete